MQYVGMKTKWCFLTQVSGRAIFAQPLELCSVYAGFPREQIWWEKRRHAANSVNYTAAPNTDKIFGIVRRGLCPFATKTGRFSNCNR
jgi:hypothetical protein